MFTAVVRRRRVPEPGASVLTWCARPRVPECHSVELRRRAALVTDWPTTLRLAEEHGLGPLLYAHLVRRQIACPPVVQRQLRGLYARHRRINAVLRGALGRILEAMDGEGVEALVLKGPALVDAVYGDRGLRPISDLDLLVSEHDAVPALRILGRLGYHVELPTSEYAMRRHHHLKGATRSIDGVPVMVEIHRDALSADRGASMMFDEQRRGARGFDLDGRTARTLEPHEMLWHLSRHLVGLWHPLRLVWVADVVGYAERFVDELDWAWVARKHPFVISTLELINELFPVDERVVEHAALSRGPRTGQVGADYEGWPRMSALRWDGWAARGRFVRATLVPPDWWLRLNYGTGVTPAGRWRGWRRHLVALAGIVWRRLGDVAPRRVRRPSSREQP